MRVLTVPNWSFYDPAMVAEIPSLLGEFAIDLHYAQGDIDHGRTVTAFSGEQPQVVGAIMRLAQHWLPRIDMRAHSGVHPRIGALDVCPFVPFDEDISGLLGATDGFGIYFAGLFGIPVFMYEFSKPTATLPDVRRGGLEGYVNKEIEPDFGPPFLHPRWGASVVGVRRPLIAMNVNLATDDLNLAKGIASNIRARREATEPGWRGVRALGLPLASRGIVQVSMNLTEPDHTHPDAIIEFIESLAPVAGTELVGVIRPMDLQTATRLEIHSNQIVDTI